MPRPDTPLPLPADTASAYAQHGADCQNLGLLLQRYPPQQRLSHEDNVWDIGVWTRIKRRGDYQEEWSQGNAAIGLWLRDEPRQEGDRFVQLDPPLKPSQRINADALAAYHQRWRTTVTQSGADPFESITQYRLVVGLGADTVLETSITLDRMHGFPIIPGSALKGLTRTLALTQLAETLGVYVLDPETYQQRKQRQPPQNTPLEYLEEILESEQSAWAKLLAHLKQDDAVQNNAPIRNMDVQQLAADERVQTFRQVFGFLGEAGRVVFYDAVPTASPTFAVDIMNVHYPDYYRDSEGGSPPSDDQNPQPVSFLTVEKGTTFQFAVGPRHPEDSDDQNAAGEARSWLETALETIGAGAKTAAGYGIFDNRPPVEFEPVRREPERRVPKTKEPPKRSRGLADLEEGEIVEGIVDGIADFGAFVDIGVEHNGLVYFENIPGARHGQVDRTLSVGQRVRVRIQSVDLRRKRISLSMEGLEQPE